jgi:hypothetical protein
LDKILQRMDEIETRKRYALTWGTRRMGYY